jgi:membrane protein DedA with SNARE-associated domain
VTLNPADWPGCLAYVVVFVAALIEGEVVFVAAATLAGQGALDPFGVVAAGTLGAAAGDQIPFYLLRYRVRSWLDRLPAMRRVSGRLIGIVSRRGALLSFLIRFAPGLRIAIASACAYADVPPLIFSTCSVLGALVWATCIVVVVGWLGPEFLSRFGISGWWAVIVPALILLILLKAIAWRSRRSADDS